MRPVNLFPASAKTHLVICFDGKQQTRTPYSAMAHTNDKAHKDQDFMNSWRCNPPHAMRLKQVLHLKGESG